MSKKWVFFTKNLTNFRPNLGFFQQIYSQENSQKNTYYVKFLAHYDHFKAQN